MTLRTIIARCAPKALLIHFAVGLAARSSALAAELPWSWWTSWGLVETRRSEFETGAAALRPYDQDRQVGTTIG